MKTDDDAFVRVDEVLTSLNRIQVNTGLLYGLINTDSQPHRSADSKWFISLEVILYPSVFVAQFIKFKVKYAVFVSIYLNVAGRYAVIFSIFNLYGLKILRNKYVLLAFLGY